MTKEEMKLISKIVDKAFETEMQAHYGSKLDMFMDIEFVHKDCPLNLQRLLEADNFNFFHDVIGIYENLNRKTKKLENCFVPRFTSNVLSK
jgi:hypothetical protein